MRGRCPNFGHRVFCFVLNWLRNSVNLFLRPRGGWWSPVDFCAVSLLAFESLAPEGRVRPRGDASDGCSPRFMVQEHPTLHVLRRCKGVLPCGWSAAARRAYALVTGPRGRFGWNFARLARHQASATKGRVRPRGDASNDCSSWFMVQVHLTMRVLRRCKGVLPRGRSDAARRAKALVTGPSGARISGSSRVLPPREWAATVARPAPATGHKGQPAGRETPPTSRAGPPRRQGQIGRSPRLAHRGRPWRQVARSGRR